MGKRIIIKNADFSEVAIQDETQIKWNQIALESGGVNVATESLFGVPVVASTRLRTSGTITVPNGKTLRIKGLKGVNSMQEGLKFSYAYYSQDHTAISILPTTGVPDVVGTDTIAQQSSTYFQGNLDGLDEAAIINNRGGDYYFAFVFALTNRSAKLDTANYPYLDYVIE